MNTQIISPTWPAPKNIKAFTTTRQGGCSSTPYESFNLGAHVGDKLEDIQQNRQILQTHYSLPQAPSWLNQVHGKEVFYLTETLYTPPNADASITNVPGIVCTIMSADCLPILLCDEEGKEVAAIHAGWRSLAAGIIENTLRQMKTPASRLLAWLGPAISAKIYEVGAEVQQAIVQRLPQTSIAFTPRQDKFLADLYAIARLMLKNLGVDSIYGEDHCTYSESELFFSARRDKITGRMASLIWIDLYPSYLKMRDYNVQMARS